MSDETERLSWRPREWLRAAGHPFSRAKLYAEIKAGRLDSRKAGRSTLIVTPPAAYLASLPRGVNPAFGTARRRKAGAA
jgi:hypothetical protein